ncbi:MAG: TIGR03936 family radical SAM-associated protein [Bacillota bacterium]
MKYVIRFKKTGVICYTSHLDIMKVFKRSFKRAGIRLSYSQGFNPHPKMGFAQPLSLGYESLDEYIEFETADTAAGDEIFEKMRALMPEGLELLSISEAAHAKTLAANTVAADYTIEIPFGKEAVGSDPPVPMDPRILWQDYMGQEQILTLKKQKKKKEPVLVDIRPKIREMVFYPSAKELRIDATLDSGSDSNLSPELVITTVLDKFGLDVPRSEIGVTRTKIHFKEHLT